MKPLVNDRWQGAFTVSQPGRYFYAIQAWVDRLKSWRGDFKKKVDAGQDGSVDLIVGAALLYDAAKRAPRPETKRLEAWPAALTAESTWDPELAALMEKYPDRLCATTFDRELAVAVDREGARFSAW